MRHLGIVLVGIAFGCEHASSAPSTQSPEPAPQALLAPAEAPPPEDEQASVAPPPGHTGVEQTLRIDGERSEAEVQSAMREHFTALSHCFDLAVAHADRINPDGAVVVRGQVGADGAVRDTEVELSELGDAPTERCLAQEVAHWRLPPGPGDTTLHLPFYMRSY